MTRRWPTIGLGVYLYKVIDGVADVYEGRLQQADKLYLAGMSQTLLRRRHPRSPAWRSSRQHAHRDHGYVGIAAIACSKLVLRRCPARDRKSRAG